MSFLEDRKVLTREKRLSTLSNYNGELVSLREETGGAEIRQKIRTFGQVYPDEIIAALQVLSKIKGAAVVVHGAVGCSAAGLYLNEKEPFSWYSTNLNERDTILGGDEKLRQAIQRAYEEQHPSIIFVVGTPVIAINNDDVRSVILEMREETGTEIQYVQTDGFKTKTPRTGYDLVSYAVLRTLYEKRGDEVPEKKDFVNVISYTENRQNVAAFLEILQALGIPWNLLPAYGNTTTIARAAEARASVVLCREEGAYLADQLEEVYGVPRIHALPPVGRQRTGTLLRKLGRILGAEERVNQYLAGQTDKTDAAGGRKILAGKKIFLNTSLDQAVGFAEWIHRLGGEISGLSIPEVDVENRKYLEKFPFQNPGTPVIVGSGQLAEKANALHKNPADYYLTTEGDAAFAAEYGAIPVSLAEETYFGFAGERNLINVFARAERYGYQPESPLYSRSWLRRSGNWYVKQEVT